MAQELPGFYFDAELNRYFPLSRKRGRSGSTAKSEAAATSSSSQGDNKQGPGDVQGHGLNSNILQLLQARETSSGMRKGSGGEQGFQTQFLESQAAHPQVWEYDKTRSLADGALQQLRVRCQAVEGERDADILVLGGSTGLFQLRGTTLLDGIQASSSDIVRPRHTDGVTRSEREPPGLWSVMDRSQFSSRITAIKRLGQEEEAAQPQQSAIMTTLGAGKVCGSLYVLDFKQGPEIQEWDRSCPVPFQVQRRVKSPCSVWTAEASPNGIAASLGMDSGAGLVALERSDVTWLCRSGSAVLSQQFDKQGNILFCGFRNGAISTIDLRKPAPKEATLHHEAAAALKSLKNQQRTSQSFGNGKHSNKRRVDDYFCSHSKIMRMGSAVCSLLLLQNDENYLLASAMNGAIEQWDRRMVENGAVRAFEGHNNTHTTLQLAVDPTKTLLVSGGEDCALRIWSLASGRLLHAAKNLTSPASCICWPAMMQNGQRKGRVWEEPPFESNFSWGFWFGSSSGLHYMHGA